MRKLLSIFVLFCLFFLTAGYHLLYHFRIAEAKREMKHQLLATTADQLTTLYFSEAELGSLEWEGNAEFRYRGTLYDVVKLEKQNGETIIRCLSDEKETALAANYLNTQKRSSNNSSDALLKILGLPYLLPSIPSLHAPAFAEKQPYGSFCCFFPAVGTSHPLPPPKVC